MIACYPRAASRALSISDLRALARRRLPKSVFDFIDGGAEDELTLRGNRDAFEQVRIVPRILVDVDQPDLATSIVGQPADAPFVIAPMGACALAWPGADLAIARAARDCGIPYTLSTMATVSIERMASDVGGRLWFQLYVLRDMDFCRKLIARAAAAGYEALVVTVDLPAGGKREKDLRNGISVPIRPSLRHVLAGIAHPDWALRLLSGGMPDFENVHGLLNDNSAGMTIAAKVGQNLNASFQWDDLRRMRDQWKGRLIVKGVEHPDDARQLCDLGADAIWVSNHGGRQLDGALPTLQALPGIARAIDGRVPLLLDSGVRRGVDALKARMLGAQAVCIGRAALFGAAAGGEAGARQALDILTGELRLAMKLSGTPNMAAAAHGLAPPAASAS
ncbi:alpha-hydroxy acid oxidase [Paracandidimonas soli]|uniref:alpha-hydroxy acid oxidase n=1 Tax=Paracandidimonas soli TaxID=1917182 RepID=UPI00333E2655